MTPLNEQRSFRRCGPRRRGHSLTFALLGILVVACLTTATWFFAGGRKGDADAPELLTTTVWRGPYDFAVNARGTVESASNVELSCEVRSRGGGTAILNVLAEGTTVKQGDTVVELDTSDLLLQEEQQKVLVSTRLSLLAQAENTLKAAEIAKTEYLEGLFVSQEKEILSELFLAQRAKATAEATLESTRVLYEKTIASSLQVQAAHHGLEDAINKLDGAQTKLDTLRNLTRQKELTLLEANIASASADLKAQKRNLQLEQRRLKNIQEQIGKCTIKAAAAGQVVYVNEPEYYRSSTYAPFVVAPGSMARERQVIIWLPNADDMQVSVTVHEARVTLIRPGMPVSIRVEALDDELIEGEVTKVSQFAEPSGFWSGINKYGVTIKIKNPSHALRVGMNAEAWIHVKQLPDALQLPVQALAESKGRYFSLVNSGGRYETREIAIGSINDQVAAIDRGLAEGDEVVINPRSARGLLNIPDLPETTAVAIDEIKRARAGEPIIAAAAIADGDERGEATGDSDATAAGMVAQYLENDADKDDKLSKDEVARMDSRLQQHLATADANADGFVERRELLAMAANVVQQMREKDYRNSGGVPRPGVHGGHE
jgi:HlyD family secretion protein